jgi:hypothetical protein
MSIVNNALHVTGKGNLNLGAEADDGAGDATHGWAKSDVWWNVPLNQIFMGAGAIGAVGRTSAGIYTAAITAAAATQIVVVPLVMPQRKFAGTPGGAAPHGVKVLDLAFGYTIGTAGETSIAVTFNVETPANATARALVSNPFGSGAVTYENPLGTVAATLPVATQATPYVVRAIPATPAFINADMSQIYAEISFVNPGTSVATLTFISWHVALGLY